MIYPVDSVIHPLNNWGQGGERHYESKLTCEHNAVIWPGLETGPTPPRLPFTSYGVCLLGKFLTYAHRENVDNDVSKDQPYPMLRCTDVVHVCCFSLNDHFIVFLGSYASNQ